MKSPFSRILAALLLLAGAQQAFAAGTVAGTAITNQATINYAVGGVTQPAQASNVSSFVVDRKINVTVAVVGSANTSVVPGATSQVTTYTVTNNSNATMDYALSALNKTGGTGPFGGTDDFDVTNLRIYVDSNGNGVYDPGVDTVTYIDELAPDASKTVFVVVDVPSGRTNNDLAVVSLTATAADGGTPGSLGTTSVQTTGADTPGSIDTVFADVAGDTDAARDGKHSAAGAYKVVTATLTVVKTSAVFSDPYNNTTNPKAIPGARVRYTIVVTNSGGASATGIVLTDTMPTNTTYVASSITLNSTAQTDAVDGDSGSFSSNVVTVAVGVVATSGTATVTFDVTLN